MVTAMNLLAIIIAVTVLTAVAYTVLYVIEYVRDDGYGRLGGYRNPPRSHVRDSFDPRHFA
jgi:hypothetical protein